MPCRSISHEQKIKLLLSALSRPSSATLVAAVQPVETDFRCNGTISDGRIYTMRTNQTLGESMSENGLL